MSDKSSVDGQANGSQDKTKCFTSGTDVITVIVGKEDAQIKHLVHENILRKCPFFDKCLDAGMKESQERTINLPDDSPAAIDVLIHWLYFEKVVPKVGPSFDSIRAYNAADKYCLPELQNALIDRFRGGWKSLSLFPGSVSTIWKLTPEGCKLREASLDQLRFDIVNCLIAHRGDKDNRALQLKKLLNDGGELTVALFMKVAETTLNGSRVTIPNPSQMTGCVYHVHQDGKKCA